MLINCFWWQNIFITAATLLWLLAFCHGQMRINWYRLLNEDEVRVPSIQSADRLRRQILPQSSLHNGVEVRSIDSNVTVSGSDTSDDQVVVVSSQSQINFNHKWAFVNAWSSASRLKFDASDAAQTRNFALNATEAVLFEVHDNESLIRWRAAADDLQLTLTTFNKSAIDFSASGNASNNDQLSLRASGTLSSTNSKRLSSTVRLSADQLRLRVVNASTVTFLTEAFDSSSSGGKMPSPQLRVLSDGTTSDENGGKSLTISAQVSNRLRLRMRLRDCAEVSLAHDGTRIDVASTFHVVVLRSASFRIEIYSPRAPIEAQVDEFGQLRVSANAGNATVFVPTVSRKSAGAAIGSLHRRQIVIDVRRAFKVASSFSEGNQIRMIDDCSSDNCHGEMKPSLSLHYLAMAAAEAQILLTSEEEANIAKGKTFQPLNILISANRSQIDLESARLSAASHRVEIFGATPRLLLQSGATTIAIMRDGYGSNGKTANDSTDVSPKEWQEVDSSFDLTAKALTNTIAAADSHAHNGGEVPPVSAIADISRSELPAVAPRFLPLFPEQSQPNSQTVTTKMIKPVNQFHTLPVTSTTHGPIDKTMSRKLTTNRPAAVITTIHPLAPIVVNTKAPTIISAAPTTFVDESPPLSFPFISRMPDTGDILIVSDDDGDAVVKSTDFDRVTSVRTTRTVAEVEETLLSGRTKTVPTLPHDTSRNFSTNEVSQEGLLRLTNHQLTTAIDENHIQNGSPIPTFTASLIDLLTDTSSMDNNVDGPSASELLSSEDNKWVAPIANVEKNSNATLSSNNKEEDNDTFIIAQFNNLDNDTLTNIDYYSSTTVLNGGVDESSYGSISNLWNSTTVNQEQDSILNTTVNNCAIEMTTPSFPRKISESVSKNLIAGDQMNLSTLLSTASIFIVKSTTPSVELLKNPVSAVTLHERTYDDYFRLMATLTRVDAVAPPQSSRASPPRITTMASSSVTVVGVVDTTEVAVEDSLWPDPAPLLQYPIMSVKVSRSSKHVNERRRLRATVDEDNYRKSNSYTVSTSTSKKGVKSIENELENTASIESEVSKTTKVFIEQLHSNSPDSSNKQSDEQHKLKKSQQNKITS